MKNLSIKRGIKGTLIFNLPGDHSERDLSFVVKRDESLTADRLIEKTTASGITATYKEASNITMCEVEIEKDDTQSLTAQDYPWDIDSVDPNDADDVQTPESGQITIVADVQTPLDGLVLPDTTAAQILDIYAVNGGVGDLITINASGEFEFISLSDLKDELDGLNGE